MPPRRPCQTARKSTAGGSIPSSRVTSRFIPYVPQVARRPISNVAQAPSRQVPAPPREVARPPVTNVAQAPVGDRVSQRLQETIQAMRGWRRLRPILRLESHHLSCILTSMVGISNCLRLANIARKYKLRELIEQTDNFILKRFEDVSCGVDFLNLSFYLIKFFIRHDKLKATSEIKIFEAAMKWINHSTGSGEDRSVYLPDLLEHVRFSQMDMQYLSNIYIEYPIIRASDTSLSYVEEAKLYLSQPRYRDVFRGERFRQRIGILSLYLLGFKTNVARFNPITNEWIEMRRVDTSKEYFLVTESDNALYLFFREEDDEILGENMVCISIETYYPGRGETTLMPIIVTDTFDFNATFYKHSLYIVGGKKCDLDSPSASSEVQACSPPYTDWNQCAPLQTGRYNHAIVATDDYIYAIGGETISTLLNTVERYDAILNNWQYVAPMIHRRSDFECVVLKGYIYAIGGSSHTRMNCERYDFVKNVWKNITAPPYNSSGGRTFFSAAAIGGLLHVIEIKQNANNRLNLFIYNPDNETWSTKETMRTDDYTTCEYSNLIAL